MPVLDEARALPALLDHLAALPGRWEVVVADGGSGDGSAELARSHRLAPRVVSAPRGRARQQNAGAAAATGELLVFLHADSRLPARRVRLAHAARCAIPACPGGNFALRFDGDDRFSRGLTALVRAAAALRRLLRDSTLWLRRADFEGLGGFADLPVMEDHELVRRLERRGRTACLPGPALTSPRRWRALGWWRTGLAWTLIRWAFIAGVPARRLAGLYRAVR